MGAQAAAVRLASRGAGLLRADERALVGTAGGVFALASAGAAMTASAADAMFLAELGPAHLGQAVAVSSALLAVVLAVVGGLSDRLERRRVLAALSIISAVVIAGLAGLALVAPRAAAIVTLIGGKQLAAATDLAFWIVIAERIDARRSQRLLPVLAATGGAGAAAGAILVVPLAAATDARGVLVAAAGLLAVAGILATRLSHTRRVAAPPARVGALIARSWRDGARAVRRHPLAAHLAIVVGAAGVFGSLVYFALGVEVAARGGSTADLAQLLGGVRGGAQIVTLVVQLVVAPRLLARLGTGRALLLAPLVALAAGLGLVVAPILAVAIAAQASARVLDSSIETPAEKLAQTLLPTSVRGRVAGFLEGTAKRAGAVLGGLIAAALAGSPTVFYAIMAVAAALWLLSAIRIARELPALAIEHVSEAKSETDAFGVVDDRAVQALLRELDGPRSERAAEVLARLHEHGRIDAVTPLARAAIERGQPGLWRALITTLDTPAEVHGPALLEAAQAATTRTRELAVRAVGLAGGMSPDALEQWRAARTDAHGVESRGTNDIASAGADHIESRGADHIESRGADVVESRAADNLESRAANDIDRPADERHPRPDAEPARRKTNSIVGELARHALESAASAVNDRARADDERKRAVAATAEVARLRLLGDFDDLIGELADLAREPDPVGRVAIDELVIEIARHHQEDRVLEVARHLMRALRRGRGDIPSRTAAFTALAGVVEGARERRTAELSLLRADLLELARERVDQSASKPAPDTSLVSLLQKSASTDDASEVAAALRLYGELLQGADAIDPDDLRRIARALGEPDDDVRTSAEAALAGLGPAAAGELIATAAWGRRRARDRAAALLADLPVTAATVDRLVDAELDALEQTAAAITVFTEPGDELVARRLDERLREIAHTVLLLVAARRRSRAISSAAVAWQHARAGQERARALAVIEAALPRALVSRLVEAVDDLTPLDRRAQLVRAGIELPTRDAVVRAELAGRDRLSRALVLHVLGAADRSAHRDTIARAAQSEALAASASALLRKLSSTRVDEGAEDMPSRVETLIALGRVPLLASLSTRQLADVAERARWITAREGSVVITSGDAIDALIVVEDGELALAERRVGKGDVVDELACVAPATAAADLKVTRTARLIRLERVDFEELVDDVPGLASAVCRALGERARKAEDATYRSPLTSRSS